MLRSFVPFLAPLLLAAAPAVPSASTLSLTPWWEKVTVTMTDDGKAQGCRYESSATGSPNKDCKVVGASIGAQAAPSHDQYATITFERRFDPGGAPPADAVMQKGDKLLGRQVMALAIDGSGKVGNCKIVSTSGETGLEYGCEEAAAEHFEAKAAAAGFMTILVYGHTEHVV